ncbi:hypothetical protein KIN_33740 [Litoreibacter roseus]|uniref:DUF1963 domain-containing protein n=1 Tax=Litoreibacter roseus TaxID=2601869 RepID=A0A6N6JKB8_9RHOB|nr:hypothetical protein KIN_33740 [Litoreibacter roseus]
MIFHDGPTEDWVEITQPDDMPQTYSDSHRWNDYNGGPGTTFPKWEVRPTKALQYPHFDRLSRDCSFDSSDEIKNALYENEQARMMREDRERVFGSATIWPDGIQQDFNAGGARILEALPPVWLAVQIVLRGKHYNTRARKNSVEENAMPEEVQVFEAYQKLRDRLCMLSRRFEPMDVMSTQYQTEFISFLDQSSFPQTLWDDAVNFTIEKCLSHSAETAELISSDQIEHVRHRLDHRAHQCGGFPGSVQGYNIDNDYDHVLLMQFNPDRGQHWEFDQLSQYWVKEDDLRQQRWDKIFVTCEGS